MKKLEELMATYFNGAQVKEESILLAIESSTDKELLGVLKIEKTPDKIKKAILDKLRRRAIFARLKLRFPAGTMIKLERSNILILDIIIPSLYGTKYQTDAPSNEDPNEESILVCKYFNDKSLSFGRILPECLNRKAYSEKINSKENMELSKEILSKGILKLDSSEMNNSWLNLIPLSEIRKTLVALLEEISSKLESHQ